MTPTLGLVMIVRDETARIAACLAAARPYISSWTIVDTGSVDETPELVSEALAGIPGTLHHRRWVDFGTNRSEALALARGTADWLLLLDADMVVTIDPAWEPDPAVQAYGIEMGDPAVFSWRLPLLVRGDLPWVKRGAVHDYLALEDGRPYVTVPTDAVRITRADSSDPEKTRRQAEGLLREFGDGARLLFYLAQTARELGDAVRARDLYRARAALGGFEEERWYAAYRAATLEPDWPTRQATLIEAWEARPRRLEPLHALVSELNYRGAHWNAYAMTAAVDAAPPPDELFVHGWVWDWGMKFERSIAAHWVGRPDECRRLCDELLANPRLPAHIREQVLVNRSYTDEREAA